MQIATPYSLKCYFLVYYEELLHFRIVQFLQCFRARDIEMGSDNTRKKQGQIIFDVRISVYKKIGKIRNFFIIEDVERGAELSFSGLRVRFADPPLHHRQILFSNDQILASDRQTDGQTDRQTDAINIFWAFLVKN